MRSENPLLRPLCAKSREEGGGWMKVTLKDDFVKLVYKQPTPMGWVGREGEKMQEKWERGESGVSRPQTCMCNIYVYYL